MKRKEGKEWNQIRGGPKGGEPAADPRFSSPFLSFSKASMLSRNLSSSPSYTSTEPVNKNSRRRNVVHARAAQSINTSTP